MKYLILATILFVATTGQYQCNNQTYVDQFGYSSGDALCAAWENPMSSCDQITGDCTGCEGVAGYCDYESDIYAQQCEVYSWGSYCAMVSCNATMPCPGGYECNPSGECELDCTVTNLCWEDWDFCNLNTGSCETQSCDDLNPCPDNAYCNDYGYCLDKCTDTLDTCLDYQFCNITSGQCEDQDYYVYGSSDDGFILDFLVNPEDFTCDANNTGVCDAVGAVCNTEAEICIVGCTTNADCLDFATGSGLNKCVDGACTTDGTCTTSDDECASQLGFTCNTMTGECEQPTGCTDDTECTTPGIGKCDTSNDAGVGVCIVETCETTTDCISEGYVCQSPPGYCIESCVTSGNCDGIVNAALTCNTDTGLCETGCTDDMDCTGNVNTCLEGVCIITCETAQDCSDVGLPVAVCTEGSCVPTDPDNVDPSTVLCDTTEDCDVGTCEETPEGTKVCVDEEVPAGGESCSKDGDCETGYKCNKVAGVCYPACSSTQDCIDNFGDYPCKSQTVGTGPLSVTIKYCDVSDTLPITPSPTEAPRNDDGVESLGVMGVVSVVMGLMAFM